MSRLSKLVAALVLLGAAGGGPAIRAQVNWVGVPVDATTPMAFEVAGNWQAPTYDPVPSPGPEETPPGFDSTFFIENFNGVVALTEERSGENGTEALGAMAIGNNPEGMPAVFQMQTLLISADVTFTGLERSGSSFPAGEYNGTLRHIRVGRGRDASQPDVNAWAFVKQTAGTVQLNQHVTAASSGGVMVEPQPERAEILLSSDKDKSAGSTWEVGGTASLFVPDDLRIGDRAQAVFMPGAIFRVRGSNVGAVEVGDAFQVASDAGLWDADRPAEFGNRLRFNRGKSVTEFVLDAGGVTPITVLDNLDVGDYNNYPSTHPMAGVPEYTYGFLRVKLSEPTMAGSGVVGSGNELVLFQADRISTDTGGVPTNTDFDEGRFFDPDRPSAVGPHRPMFDSDNMFDGPGVVYTVISDYAGATYTWRLDYNTSPDDDVLVDAVVLSELSVAGTPGDYDGGGLAASDLNQILAARGTAIPLGSAQNEFDLNADDAVDNLDAIQWITHAGLRNSRLGDFDLDGDVDDADLTIWRSGYGTGTSYTSGDANFDGAVDGGDFLVWQRNVGGPNPAVGAAGAVPEPGAAALLALGGISLLSTRQRR